MTSETEIVPANDGWVVAVLVSDGPDGHYLSFDPIIAWSITRTDAPLGRIWFDVIPLTISGDPDANSNQWAIRRPDGRFEIPGDCAFDSEQEAFSELKRRAMR